MKISQRTEYFLFINVNNIQSFGSEHDKFD